MQCFIKYIPLIQSYQKYTYTNTQKAVFCFINQSVNCNSWPHEGSKTQFVRLHHNLTKQRVEDLPSFPFHQQCWFAPHCWNCVGCWVQDSGLRCQRKDSTSWPDGWVQCVPVISAPLSGLWWEGECPWSAAAVTSQTLRGAGVDHAPSLNQTLRLQHTKHGHY